MYRIALLSLLALFQSVSADIAFEMVHTSGHPIRLGVPEFTDQDESTRMVSDLMHAIVSQDLARSGVIGVVESLSDMEVAGFMKYGSKGLELTIKVNDNDTIGAKLEDVSRTFYFDQQHYRQAAHHVSDFIYQQLTGYQGVFSTKIAYIHKFKQQGQMHYRLEVADADGANVEAYLDSTEPLMSPRWSPDGKHIMYVSFENEKAAIFLVDALTKKREVIADYPGINNAPTWHPSGKKVAFTLTIDGSPNIYEMDLNSRKLVALTHGWSINTEPTYSKDGKKMYFTSNRSGSPQIYAMDLASKNITRLTYQGRYNASPIINDDDVLAMLHHTQKGFSIASMSNNDLMVLVDSQFEQTPSFSPNGQFLVYATLWQQKSILGIVSVDGNIHMRLNLDDVPGEIQDPDWSPWFV